jgi:hypothetical protein
LNHINSACEQIYEHLNSHGVKLLQAVYYFKVDIDDELVLLFGTNLKTDKFDSRLAFQREVQLTIPEKDQRLLKKDNSTNNGMTGSLKDLLNIDNEN